VNPALSEGLPPFLAQGAGLEFRFYDAAGHGRGAVSENKVLAHPASVDSITTSGNKEDYVSMGMTAANKLKRIVEKYAQRAGHRGHGRGPGNRLSSSVENFKARTGRTCGDPLGLSHDGEGPRDVQRFRAHRGNDRNGEDRGNYPLRNQTIEPGPLCMLR